MRFYPPHSGQFSFALPVSNALVILCIHLLHLPQLGLVILSVTERTLRVHSLGALHSVPGLAIWFMGSGCLVSGVGVLHCGLVILFTSLHSRKLLYDFRDFVFLLFPPPIFLSDMYRNLQDGSLYFFLSIFSV